MLPSDAKARKDIPIFSGFLKYFPKTAAAIAKLSVVGNEQHNPGEPLHWARDKSTDQHDTLARHLLEVGTLDHDRVPHDVKVAWRACAGCEEYLEQNPWDESVDDILAFIAGQKATPGKFDHCPDSTTFHKMQGGVNIREPRDAGNIKSCWIAQFTDMANDTTIRMKSIGPFPDQSAALTYSRENPRNIVGIRSIQEVNYPS